MSIELPIGAGQRDAGLEGVIKLAILAVGLLIRGFTMNWQ